MDFAKILQDAHDAASSAILAKFHKGDREQPFNCGFAWVTIDGNDALARFCRKEIAQRKKLNAAGQIGRGTVREAEIHFGDKGYPRGWQWWKPGKWPSKAEAGVSAMYEQDMDFHVAAARAFQQVLADHGINATVGSRLD